jgi:outer membrane lipoprotein SlyB
MYSIIKTAILAAILMLAAGQSSAQDRFLAWGSSSGYGADSRPSDISGQSYGRGETLRAGSAFEGIVINIEPVHAEASSSAAATGTGVGGLLGALAGSTVGQGNGRIAAAVLGGVAGSVAGHSVADKSGSDDALEIVVRDQRGNLLVVVQGRAADLRVGDRVLVLNSQGNTRVTRLASPL